jgi:thiamine-monophosphate kinase
VLDAPGGRLLFASDAVVENVHFRLDLSTVAQAAQKAVTSNVSDIFAMGGEPAGIVFSAGLPGSCGEEELVSIVDGLKRACGAYGIRLFGGDTVLSPSGYFFDVAIIGSVPEGLEPFRRRGARPGDLLVLFGEVGGSLAGLRLLEGLAGAGSAAPLDRLLPAPEARTGLLEAARTLAVDTQMTDIEAACAARDLPDCGADILAVIARHVAPLTFRPPVSGSPEWAQAVTAMIDISDGLGKDLASLCGESEVGAIVSEEKIPVPAVVAAAIGGDRGKLTDFALSSGEEYVALAAVDPGRAGQGVVDPGRVPAGGVVIGTVTERSGGLLIEDGEGGMRRLPPAGYEHDF